ncbi:MAG: amidohydrolase family protein [Pirellulaceae bacterium]|nr:amidohydrolase family protein [Pirellulaceae bacterium]
MRIDAHQHFWTYDSLDYPWIPRNQVSRARQPTGLDTHFDSNRTLDRDFLPLDLWPLLSAAGLDGCIAVQARQSLRENDFLISLADEHDFILGVVGWIDLRSDQAGKQAQEFAKHPKAVGVRHVVQDELQPMFMAGEAFRRGIASLKHFDLIYDILIYEHQLPDAIALAAAFPDQQFVVDHIAKPKIKWATLDPWRSLIKKLAGFSNVVVKLSGMVTEADHAHWSVEQLDPYWQVILEAFTPSRILFGSDWPVARLASSYQRWITVVREWLVALSDSERAAIWGQNAHRVYFQ